MMDGATVKAQLWDTAGQEKYRAITVAHYRKALGALVVYDITRKATFDNVQFWLDSLLNQCEQSICIMVIGNKLDLAIENPKKRQVHEEDIRNLRAMHPDIKFMETSTVTKANVNQAFEELLNDIYQQR